MRLFFIFFRMALSSRRIISIKGDGVYGFLQGLITQDVEKVRSKNSIAGAVFLNPKGRVISDCLLVNKDDTCLLIDVPTERLDTVSNLLTRHRLRLPLSIDQRPDLGVHVALNMSPNSLADPRCTKLPSREYKIIDNIPLDESLYRMNRLLCGVVEGDEIPLDSSIPIFYNLDLFNCISFNKGCYTGQELVTRTIRRGIVRKRLFPFKASTDNPVMVGDKLVIGGREIGSVIASESNVGVCMIQSDEAMNTKEQIQNVFKSSLNKDDVVVGSQTGQIILPSYCS